ncbi:MAG: hypothetical protein SGI92_27370 [Bryobacteraceae bacterium]|nr:hypothetical protein [Bryobacteraceae bacterium]
MIAGFFAPLPPARTGVADYAAHLLTALRQQGEVRTNAPGTVNLYHLGNNQLHAEIYRAALRHPGVIVLHDAVLHHFALGHLSRNEYLAEFTYNYGAWTAGLAADLWASRATSASDPRYFAHPLIRRVCETSRAVIVHNPAAARIVRSHAREARVFEIPHLLFPEPTPSDADLVEVRHRLGVRPLEPLCGLFGHLRESRRVRSVIEACGRAGMRLLVAGPCSSDLAKALAPYFAQPWVIRRDYSSANDFRLLTHAVDICANLRYPAAGETSGISVRLMGAGKAVLVTDSEENARYPETSCVRIESGLAERDHLTAVLDWLKQFPAHARAIGARAADHVRREHDPARVAEACWSVLRAAA